jgi:hypothetical protein
MLARAVRGHKSVASMVTNKVFFSMGNPPLLIRGLSGSSSIEVRITGEQQKARLEFELFQAGRF